MKKRYDRTRGTMLRTPAECRADGRFFPIVPRPYSTRTRRSNKRSRKHVKRIPVGHTRNPLKPYYDPTESCFPADVDFKRAAAAALYFDYHGTFICNNN